MNEAVPMQVLLAGVRGYFWDFERVTPFPVPALLKNLPEDGTETVSYTHLTLPTKRIV